MNTPNAGSSAPAGSARNVHTLKIRPEYLDAVGFKHKAFEVRKDDRGFKIGDILQLREWDGDQFGIRCLACFVSYILRGGEAEWAGIKTGYCVLGIKLPANHVWPPNATGLTDRPGSQRQEQSR